MSESVEKDPYHHRMQMCYMEMFSEHKDHVCVFDHWGKSVLVFH